MDNALKIFRKNILSNRLLYTRFLTMEIGEDVITIEEVRTLKDDSKVFFVDVREPEEIKNTGLIPGSVNIPLNSVAAALETTPGEEFKNKYLREKPNFETPIVFTCRSGRRAGEALEIAKKLGFKNVRNYKGSWLEWEKYLPK